MLLPLALRLRLPTPALYEADPPPLPPPGAAPHAGEDAEEVSDASDAGAGDAPHAWRGTAGGSTAAGLPDAAGNLQSDVKRGDGCRGGWCVCGGGQAPWGIT